VTNTLAASRRPTGTARARPGQLLGAIVLDLLTVAAVAVPLALAAASGDPQLVLLGVLVLLALLAGQLVGWSRSGRTFGAWIAGVRQVTSSDGAPPGLSRAIGANWFADVRRGRDPVDPVIVVPLVPPPVAPAASPATAPVPLATPDAVPALRSVSRALLVVDGRVSGPVGDGVVLGRNPTAAGDVRAVAIADIGREISKVHLALRLDADGRVWADDLASTNGSTLVRADGTAVPLLPGTEQEIGIGDVVRLGSHTVAVQFVTEVKVAAP
jgi:hypothetical protein